jgi:hypothetical protein
VNSIRRIDSFGGLHTGRSKILCGVPLHSSRTRRAVLHNAAAFGLLGVTGLLIPTASANALRVGQPAPPSCHCSAEYQQANANNGLTVLGFSLDEPDRLDEVRAMVTPLHFPVGLLSASQAPVWTPERLQRVVAPLLAQAV